jgi:hypothetical protein
MSEFKITANRTANRNLNFPYADAWTVRITNPRGQVIQRQYYMGTGHNGRKPTLAEVMESLTTDAACVADTNLSEFIRDYGYEDYKDGQKAYNACKRTANRLETFLTEDEWSQFTDQ